LASDSPLLEVEGLESGYGPLRILRGINLQAERGEVVGIFGRNGAGKTTLLETISGLVRPTSGSVLLNGRELRRRQPYAIARGGIALVPQWCGLFPGLTIENNIRLGCRRSGKSRVDIKQRVEETFDRFPGLAARRNVKAGALSGGEQRILAIAKALVRDPIVLLLDEPSIGLAPIIVDQIAEVIQGLRGADRLVLIAEQRVDWVLDMVDRGLVIEGGAVTNTLTLETRSNWLESIGTLLGLNLADSPGIAGSDARTGLE
jgi:branched-chain amino acid transport system ATP-binding protein